MRILIAILTIVCSLTCRANDGKMSAFVRQAAMEEQAMQRRVKAKGMRYEPRTITAFVRTSDTEALKREGCSIYAQWDDIVIAAIPLSKIKHLAELAAVKRIEAGRSCTITNDTTALVTKASQAWTYSGVRTSNGDIVNGLRGDGVVVGVMDIGFDLTHPTFYSADMQTYRIKQFWDMLDQSSEGLAVKGDKDTIFVGRQYIGTAALLAKEHAADGLIAYHGTHTTGTAAGSGSEGSSTQNTSSRASAAGGYIPGYFSGMAPNADICLVANCTDSDFDLIPKEDHYKYTLATDMLGFKYIFDYAESVGKPCVINFSEGSHDDLEESILYQEVLNKMVGPGRIICSSAGNEGWKGSYMHKPAGKDKSGAFLLSGSKKATYVMRSAKPVTFTLRFYPAGADRAEWTYDATGLSAYPDSVMEDTIIVGKEKFSIMLSTYPSCYDKQLLATDFVITDLQGREIATYNTPISLNLQGIDNDIEVFNAGGIFTSCDADPALNEFTYDHNILFPGSADNVICVGNNAYRTVYLNYENIPTAPFGLGEHDGIISIYSSKGPAISGQMKPDVCAPGMNVVSSFSSFFRENNPTAFLSDDVRHFMYNSRKYPWAAASGTSMSSPVVTGIIALWLQVCPTLSPDDIKDIFAHSCMHYDNALTYPNPDYGYGQIDAMAGLKYIQQKYTGIEDIVSKQHSATPVYYDINGRCLGTQEPQHGFFIVKDGRGTRKCIK